MVIGYIRASSDKQSLNISPCELNQKRKGHVRVGNP